MAREPQVVELDPPPEPWDVVRRLAVLDNARPIFFDSAGGPKRSARYSYFTAMPYHWLEFRGPGPVNPFAALQSELGHFSSRAVPELPPFQGGAAGLIGYDLCHWLERLPRSRHDEFAIPDLSVGLYDWVISWDHDANRAWLISHDVPKSAQRFPLIHGGRGWTNRQRIEAIQQLLARPAPALRAPDERPIELIAEHALLRFPDVMSNFSRPAFEATVRRAIEYTHAGDCFQVNLAQRLITPLRGHPLQLYDRLRRINPAPFAGYFDAGRFQIASASPERFLKASNRGEVETYPIKGTRPRGATAEQDAALKAELLTSPKDRAENIMIVDLLRNDLGRVCDYGSVHVPALCELETFPTVHHLVSEVRGRLRPELTAVDLLRAAFPGGSVTGAPKVRAMEIIAELEPHARGAYCGSLGWIGFDGAMDTSILIRTFTVAGGWLQFPVGGGIVADSDPAREYDETLHKAAGLLNALEGA